MLITKQPMSTEKILMPKAETTNLLQPDTFNNKIFKKSLQKTGRKREKERGGEGDGRGGGGKKAEEKRGRVSSYLCVRILHVVEVETERGSHKGFNI